MYPFPLNKGGIKGGCSFLFIFQLNPFIKMQTPIPAVPGEDAMDGGLDGG
jgi:hypothetical protein